MSQKNPLIVTSAESLFAAAEKLQRKSQGGDLSMNTILNILAGTITPGANWGAIKSKKRPVIDARASARLGELAKHLPEAKPRSEAPVLHVGGEIWVHFPSFDRVTTLRSELSLLQVIALSEILDRVEQGEAFVFCLPDLSVEITDDLVRFTRTNRIHRLGSVEVERDAFSEKVAQQRETILQTLLDTPVGQSVFSAFRTLASGDPDILAAIELGEIEAQDLLDAYGQATLAVFGKIGMKNPDWSTCASQTPEEITSLVRQSYAQLLRSELRL